VTADFPELNKFCRRSSLKEFFVIAAKRFEVRRMQVKTGKKLIYFFAGSGIT
jgi:hypothetical protein